MAGYLNQNGNSIGSLLRFIQEQKSQSPVIPPATETGSPIRGVVQEPLKAPEAIGTSRQVSIKPEAVLGQTGETSPAVAPSGEILPASTSPIGPAPSPIATSSTPTVIGETRAAVPSQSKPSSMATPSTEMKPSAPVAKTTTVAKSNPTVLGTTITPQSSKMGGIILNTPGVGQVYKSTGSPVAYPTIGPTPTPKGYQAPIPVAQPTPAPKQTAGKIVAGYTTPSLGTIVSGAIGQAWNKLFGRR